MNSMIELNPILAKIQLLLYPFIPLLLSPPETPTKSHTQQPPPLTLALVLSLSVIVFSKMYAVCF